MNNIFCYEFKAAERNNIAASKLVEVLNKEVHTVNVQKKEKKSD